MTDEFEIQVPEDATDAEIDKAAGDAAQKRAEDDVDDMLKDFDQ